MSGVAPRRFAGRDFYIPGAASKRNISSLDTGAASGSNMLVLAVTKRGIPYNATTDYSDANDRVNYCVNTNELKSKVGIGNNAYDAGRFALAPSNDPGVNGAPRVGFVRVNKATRASSTIKDIDTDDVLDVKSRDYGLYTNQIQYKLSAGTNVGKKLSVKFEGDESLQDDIDNELFIMSYSGAGTDCILTIDPAGNLTTTCTGAASDNLSIALTTFETIQSLVEYIDAQTNYSATLIGDGEFKSENLDKVITGDSVDLVGGGDYTAKATLKAVQDAFSTNELLTASLSVAAERRVPADMTSYSFLTGASDGTSSFTEWQEALEMCELIDASFVCVVTDDASVHAALSTHIKKMNSVDGKNERQGGCGSNLTDSNATRRSNAQQLNNVAVDYMALGGEQFDEFGERKVYPGFVWACAVKGMQAGNEILFSPTKKSLTMLKVEKVLDKTEQERFIQSGCQFAQPDNELGGIRIVRAITTYQGANIIANESSAMRTTLFIAKDHRAAVVSFIGEAGTNVNLNAVAVRAENKLEDYVENGWLVIDPNIGNAYRNFQFEVVADTVKVTYEGTVAIPINFIFTTHNFTVVGVRG